MEKSSNMIRNNPSESSLQAGFKNVNTTQYVSKNIRRQTQQATILPCSALKSQCKPWVELKYHEYKTTEANRRAIKHLELMIQMRRMVLRAGFIYLRKTERRN